MPANDLKELIAWLKANPDKASLGHIGPGSPAHVAGILFQKQTGTRFQFVTYRSAGQAMQDMIAGHIDLMFVAPNIALEHVRAGSIKAYAVTAKKPLGSGARDPDRGRGGIARLLRLALVCAVGAQRHAAGRDRAGSMPRSWTPWPMRRCASGSRKLGSEIVPREQQTPEALARLPEGRDREMVADPQGRRHQGGVTLSLRATRLRLLQASFAGKVGGPFHIGERSCGIWFC